MWEKDQLPAAVAFPTEPFSGLKNFRLNNQRDAQSKDADSMTEPEAALLC